jgi:hypothetical protein
MILFFSYGEASNIFGKFSIPLGSLDISNDYIFFPLWIFLFVFFFLLIKRVTRGIYSVGKFMLLLAIFATVLPVVQIIRYEITQRSYPPVKNQLEMPQAGKTDNLPDIYYILPDSYSAASVFGKYLNSNDDAFFKYLENKGFYIAQRATSNYPKTFVSLPSILNMEYVNYLSSHKNSSDQTIVAPLIQNNNVVKFLKGLGYKYYQMGSWWNMTHFNPVADDNFIIERVDIGEFNYSVLESTMLNPFLGKFLPKKAIGQSDEDKRDRILYQFNELPQVAKLPGPKFVFAHILTPHEPYIFDKSCNYVPAKQSVKQPDEEKYVNQVMCTNQKLETVINTIIKESANPPVILLQTDEGAPLFRKKISPEDAWSKASPDLLKAKFPILAAYYLPGVSKKALYPSISAVNSFRMIFNLYFDTKMPLLPDKNYIFQDLKHLYEFKDVTSEVKN